MYQIDFKQPIYVHFIGIGGISMSGLSEILLSKGFKISGSDMTRSALTDSLEAKGIHIDIGQRKENIHEPDLVVYTAAIHPDNEELRAAIAKGIPVLTRAELLGEIMANYGEAVNVAGTHGKTTTTAMITEIVLRAGLDPTVTVGGLLDSIGGNTKLGGEELFVAEACEYTNSFLSFKPTIGVILNVEADHLDFFKDIDDIRHSFREFIHRLPEGERGFLVINDDIKDLDYFTADCKCPFVTYGKNPSSDYHAKDISYDEYARPHFRLMVRGEDRGEFTLSIHGEHNVLNALAAIAVADHLGVDTKLIREALARFNGTKRRFEYRGKVNGFDIIDDYAHHPQEITATVNTALMYPHRKLYVVFQPHTYTRTRALLAEFAKALKPVDEVIMADIYAAREKNTIGISSKDVADSINAIGGNAVYLDSFSKIEQYILEHVKEGDLLITMGAGNVVNIADDLSAQ